MQWDLDERGSSADQAFALDVLGAGMAADAAPSHVVDGTGLLAGLSLDFGTDAGGPYPVEYPDVLASGRAPVALYADGSVAGIVGGGVAMFGFPLDAVADSAALAEVARRLFEELTPTLSPVGELPTEPGTTDPGTTDPGTTDPGTEPTGDDDDDDDDDDVLEGGEAPGEAGKSGCGCAAGVGSGGAWAALLLVAAVGRRRR